MVLNSHSEFVIAVNNFHRSRDRRVNFAVQNRERNSNPRWIIRRLIIENGSSQSGRVILTARSDILVAV